MLLEVTTDTEKKEYKIRRGKDAIIRRVSNEKMCVLIFLSAIMTLKGVIAHAIRRRRSWLSSSSIGVSY